MKKCKNIKDDNIRTFLFADDQILLAEEGESSYLMSKFWGMEINRKRKHGYWRNEQKLGLRRKHNKTNQTTGTYG